MQTFSIVGAPEPVHRELADSLALAGWHETQLVAADPQLVSFDSADAAVSRLPPDGGPRVLIACSQDGSAAGLPQWPELERQLLLHVAFCRAALLDNDRRIGRITVINCVWTTSTGSPAVQALAQLSRVIESGQRELAATSLPVLTLVVQGAEPRSVAAAVVALTDAAEADLAGATIVLGPHWIGLLSDPSAAASLTIGASADADRIETHLHAAFGHRNH